MSANDLSPVEQDDGRSAATAIQVAMSALKRNSYGERASNGYERPFGITYNDNNFPKTDI